MLPNVLGILCVDNIGFVKNDTNSSWRFLKLMGSFSRKFSTECEKTVFLSVTIPTIAKLPVTDSEDAIVRILCCTAGTAFVVEILLLRYLSIYH